jgi:hypothetical protein
MMFELTQNKKYVSILAAAFGSNKHSFLSLREITAVVGGIK